MISQVKKLKKLLTLRNFYKSTSTFWIIYLKYITKPNNIYKCPSGCSSLKHPWAGVLIEISSLWNIKEKPYTTIKFFSIH